MNALVRLPYEFAWRAANAVAPLLRSSDNKVILTLKSRVRLVEKIDAWAGAHRDPARPLLWMHASSVGESLQALPILNLFRERRPDLQVAFTFYSPSAEAAAKKFPADFVSYLPFDTSHTMRHVVASLKPAALVFSKLDVWPQLVEEAAHAGVPTGIISATMRSDSGRLSMMASLLLRDTYAALDAVGAVSDQDKSNIVQLGASPDRVTVTGDTRYDQVWARSRATGPTELLDHLGNNRPTIMAGSTWSADERHLLPAFTAAKKTYRRLRLIIAPHEPNASAITAIQTWASRSSLSSSQLDDPQASTADVVIVDRVGVLGDLYVLADIAYVGGGFHRAGLHSVLEPAAFAKPVVFGAPYGRTRDAEILVARDAARSAANASELTRIFSEWLGTSVARATAGQAAQQVVRNGIGAAEKSYELVNRLMS